MLKKFVFYFFMLVCLGNIKFSLAQDYGNVYLDLLENEEEFEEKEENQALKLYEMGKNYIADVKEYDDLMVGNTIDKDFSDDFKIKYKDFNNTKVKEWETYVRNGVKVYRFYKIIKDKVVDWVMNIEPPLIFDDDEYEMGDNEEYIESDTTLVVKDFKKVVAYSDKEKDVLAVKEKQARDHNLKRPTEKRNEFRKLLMERNWKGLFNLYFSDIKKEIDCIKYDLNRILEIL